MVRWDDKLPIYLQLKEKISAAIIDGSLQEGVTLPSIRQVSADYQVNPITVSKAYQLLSDSGVIDKRRGVGMFVKDGAQAILLQVERKQFLSDEWPSIADKMRRLGITMEDLPQ